MPLSAGARLGPYEILGPLGAGGMGEVYRARDPKLARDVAIKVLPGDFLEGEERKARFEREARLLAALNHPGIAAIYSFEEIPGSSPSSFFLVMELLEGETLRARLAGGALPVRKALDYAVQVARGLAAAHEKGIVHRDLKPENLFVTRDGRVKILDFGLAKLREEGGLGGAQTNLPTEAAGTEPGVVMGTLGYMSPEQVKGQPTDLRSDLFSFGAILYEMLSGTRAFHRPSAAETISAILREEPPDLSATNRGVQPGLERIVRHCLEKNPEERFYSARDLAFDLEALSSLSGPGEALVSAAGAKRRSRRGALAAVLLAAALAGGAFTWLALRRSLDRPLPTFRQLTFRRGNIWRAFFGSDGTSVLYSAEWDGGGVQIHSGRADGPDSRPFGLKGADVLAVSPGGDVAVALDSRFTGAFVRKGTLARMSSASGGAPREVAENVEYADFAPGGKDFAVVRPEAERRRLEYPIGKTLYETTGWIASPRFSPRGDRIAFIDHPVTGDDGGAIALLELGGKKTSLTPVFESASGLAWSPDGSEVWFTAAVTGGNRSLRAVSTSGKMRSLATGAGAFTLQDVSRDGRALVSHDRPRVGIIARTSPDQPERDLAWFDWSLLADLSEDGRTVLFTESGEAGGAGYSVLVRGTDGSPAVRLGEGQAFSLSPDGKRVLAIVHPAAEQQLVVYPTGAGEVRRIEHPGLQARNATWLPDGRRILLTAAAPGRGSRVYLVDSEGGAPKPLTPEGYRAPLRVGLVDEKRFLTIGPGRQVFLNALEGGEPTPVAGIDPTDAILGATAKAGTIWLRRGGGLPVRIVRFDLATGREEPYRDLAAADPTGVVDIFGPRITRDGRAYAASYGRVLSDLFVVEGLK
jgi:hypothetical protein